MGAGIALIVLSILAMTTLASKKGTFHSLLKMPRLIIEVAKIQECDDVPNNAIAISNVRMGMLGKVDFVVNADVNVNRSASSLREVSVILTKCREAVSTNTCEYFQTWRFKDNLCEHWNDHSKPWSVTLKRINPKPECPLKESLYKLRNGTIDLEVLQSMPINLEGSLWLVRVIMYENQKMVHFCADVELETHRVRD